MATEVEARRFRTLVRWGLAWLDRSAWDALVVQVADVKDAWVTPGLIEAVHDRGSIIVARVDSPGVDVEALRGRGVDGVLTE